MNLVSECMIENSLQCLIFGHLCTIACNGTDAVQKDTGQCQRICSHNLSINTTSTVLNISGDTELKTVINSGDTSSGFNAIENENHFKLQDIFLSGGDISGEIPTDLQRFSDFEYNSEFKEYSYNDTMCSECNPGYIESNSLLSCIGELLLNAFNLAIILQHVCIILLYSVQLILFADIQFLYYLQLVMKPFIHVKIV